MSKIVVVGSINVDLTVSCSRFPQVGETMYGETFGSFFGGKGANQAVACKRLGADVTMVGCIGKDANGQSVIDNFKNEGINIEHIKVTDAPTGVAVITVAENDNEIIVIKGANSLVTKDLVDEAINEILEADMVVMQLEIPLETVAYTLEICKKNNIKVLLNPAPYCEIPKEFMDLVTYITPNETETKMMFDMPFDKALEKYPNKLIMTCGSKGVYYNNGEKLVNCPANKCKVVDTTGAGDTFNGGLAIAICENKSLEEAINFAQKASSIAIGKMGAQTAMPKREEIENE